MIVREIERASQRGDGEQKRMANYLRVVLERARFDGFSDPIEQTTYDILERHNDPKRKSAGRIEDAILIALRRELFPESSQARHARRLINILNTVKSMGFQDSPR